MAERRMFAKTIIDSDAFLDMPLSTQALYFHLSMRADDDGFVNNPKKIMRMVGASQNELELLLSKRYLLAFDSGIVVIKHWKIHNYIQKDRYNETKYLDEKATITLQDNRAYTECIHNADRMETQVSIDKISIDKDKIKHKYGEYKNVLLKDSELKKLKEKYTDWESKIKSMDEGIELKGYKYKSHYLAILKWAKNETPVDDSNFDISEIKF